MSHPASGLSADKQTLLALRQLRQRVEELENAAREPIAIIGMGCCFPGAVSSPEEFWKLLEGKRDAVTEIPRWRVDLEPLFAPFPARAGRTYSRWGGLLDRPDAFDAEFFGIAPREAAAMDPQQRLLLEVSWAALEDAGINPKSLAGLNAGVFLGISASEYGQRAQHSLPAEQLSAYNLQGSALNAAAGRLAYFYGFSGAAVAIDTACSSSLVAIDRACRSLRDGESALALAAGVNLIASAEGFVIASQWGMLSPQGVCAAFDDEADGFVRGEGCGVVVLKRLRDAEAARDRIAGVILGSAVNQDGASSGLTVPNGLAQQALLREAHRRAGIEAAQVGYVEAHGTGTRLGDPIEAEALGAVFAGREQKLAIGSVKANLGHLESAAGVAGLIKLVLSLEHGEIPGQVHWSRPSAHVRWDELPLEVVTEARRWEPVDGRRIGGVSSFGFSGTNAHVVVEGRSREEGSDEGAGGEEALVISARTEAALRELVSRYAGFLEEDGEWSWAEICQTAGAGRAAMSERLALVAEGKQEAAAKLRMWLSGEEAEGVYAGHVGAGAKKEVMAAGEAGSVLAAGFVRGAVTDWGARYGTRKLRRAKLPGYAFQRERYWIDEGTRAGETGEATGRGMLGRRLPVAGVRGQFETRVNAGDWVGEHVVEGRVILPATGHLELMLEAGAETLDRPYVLEDVVLPTAVDVERERRLQVAVEEETAGRSRVRIYAERGDGEWERVSEAWLERREIARPEREDLAGIQSRLVEMEAGDAFYDSLRSRGLNFGTRFRGVRRLWRGEGEALGQIVTSTDTKATWEIWPWSLDACLQAAGIAGEPHALYLPMSIERVEVFAPMPEMVWSWVRAERLDTDTLSATILVTDRDGSAILRISRLRFRRKAEQKKVPLYRIEWERADLSRDLTATLAEELNASIPARAAEKDASESVALFEQMEELSAAYVCEALLRLGWPEAGNPLSEEDLARVWKVSPRKRPLLRRMLEIAEESGAVTSEGSLWKFHAAPQAGVETVYQNLSRQYPQGSTQLSLLRRCGLGLAEVLIGKIDGRELVFPRGSSEEMEQLYRDALPAKIYNRMVAEAVVRLAGAKGGAVRILEIGGGTGATTDTVFHALRQAEIEPEEYLFTDISPLLIRRTEERLGTVPFFRAQVFNLEQDAGAQGIAGHFNIIIAVNVLHATSDIRATVHRLKGLLAGEGQLLLTEVVGKQRWSDLTVGLLDEWWGFTDRDLRPDHPALPAGSWRKVLLGAGFSDVHVVPTAAGQGLFRHQELVMAGGAGADRAVVVVGEDQLANQIARKLHARSATREERCSFEEDAPAAVVWVAAKGPENACGGMSESAAAQVHSLLKTAVAAGKPALPPRLYVVTCGSVSTGHHPLRLLDSIPAGLATGIASERPELRCTRIDVAGENPEQDAAWVAAEVSADTEEPWIAWRNEGRYKARLMSLDGLPAANVELTGGEGIDTLAYRPAKRKELTPDEVRIAVHATALNFRDVLQASGVIHLDAPLGTDCAGVIVEVGAEVTEFRPGDAVAAIAPGCFATEVTTANALTVAIPSGLGFAQAAAQTVAYLTAEFALCEVGGLKAGERVLIHAAAGGTGLAAIHLCREMGAEVIATAGSERKRAWLRSLGIREVYDSRSTEFASQISDGVDLVLNSLRGEAIDAGFGLLRPGGRFLELGKTDLRSREEVEQRWPGVRYLPVDLTPLFAERSPWVKERLAVVLGRTAEGRLPRLPLTQFDEAETKGAFRFMARAEQIGRVVVTRRQPREIRGTHLVAGGMRGIGFRLAAWLAERGARALVLVGRKSPDEKARRVIGQLEAKGTVVQICEGDIADEAVAQRAVDLAGQELRGVWHSAGILENAPLEQQSWKSVRKVLRPKVDGAWNLHRLTLDCELDQFVLFSSWASIAGSHGQANHCAANAFLDGLAQARRAQGLPALSINWGAWAETGAAAQGEVERQLARSGMKKMSPDAALDGLLAALGSNEPQIAVGLIDWPRYLAQRPGRMQQALYARWLREDSRRFTRLPDPKRSAADERESRASAPTAAALEWTRLSPAAREPALIRILAEQVRRVLDLHADEEIDPEMPLNDLGMDSLLAVELRNSLSGALGQQFPSTLLFDYPTLRSLARHIDGQSPSSLPTPAEPPKNLAERRNEEGPARDGGTVLDLLEAIEQLSEDEVESFLEQQERAVSGVSQP